MRVGIGISMKPDGGLYVVFVFSERDVISQPLTDEEILSDRAKFSALVK